MLNSQASLVYVAITIETPRGFKKPHADLKNPTRIKKTPRGFKKWRPVGVSNPCCWDENPVS